MKSLQEALRDVKRLDSPEEDTPTDDQQDFSSEDQGVEGDQDGGDELPDELLNDPEAENVDLSLDDPSASDVDGSDAPWSAVSSGGGAGGEGDDSDAPDLTGDEQEDPQDDKELDDVANKATEDPDRQGLVRTVKGAHLVYKRQQEDGTYEEMWIYNVSNLQDEMTIRRAILSGTDIPVNKPTSPDGGQQYTMWSAGNAEMLLITGLQN